MTFVWALSSAGAHPQSSPLCCPIPPSQGSLPAQTRSLPPCRGPEGLPGHGLCLGNTHSPGHRAGHGWHPQAPTHSLVQGTACTHRALTQFRSQGTASPVRMTADVATIHTLQVGQKGSFSSQRPLQIPVHAPTGDGPGGSQYKSQLTIRNLYCLKLC